jgi:hypothetical protein
MGLFRFLKQAITGEVIQKIDIPVIDSGVIMSLVLKKERGSGDLYVVLKLNEWLELFPFDKREFETFYQAVNSIRHSLMQTSPAARPGFVPKGIIRGLKRTFTGEVIQRIDTTANDGMETISLRLKRERDTSDYYVTLVSLWVVFGRFGISCYTLDKKEFEELYQAVESMRNSLMQTQKIFRWVP